MSSGFIAKRDDGSNSGDGGFGARAPLTTGGEDESTIVELLDDDDADDDESERLSSV